LTGCTAATNTLGERPFWAVSCKAYDAATANSFTPHAVGLGSLRTFAAQHAKVRTADKPAFCWRSYCSRSISSQLQQFSCRDAAHVTEAAIEIRDKVPKPNQPFAAHWSN